MILDRLDPSADDFARATGWKLEPEGACRGELCMPLPAGVRLAGGRIDARAAADALGMGVAEDATRKLWALGPASGGRALSTAIAPEITLPDRSGTQFTLASLRGSKVFLCVWASW